MPAAAPEPRPPVLRAALWVWAAALVFSGIGLMILVSQYGDLMAVTDSESATAHTVRMGALGGLLGGVVVWVVQLLLVVLCGTGRGWARIVLTVLIALNSLIALPALLFSTANEPTMVLNYLQVGLQIAGTVLLWRPACSMWFADRAAARA